MHLKNKNNPTKKIGSEKGSKSTYFAIHFVLKMIQSLRTYFT